MSNIQQTLDSLQPYVIGIRYLEGTPLVDAVFKEGWALPEDSKIKKMKGNDDVNYYMLFSEEKGVGLDDLLKFVEKTIKLNVEREKKHELLKIKVNELKEIFKKNSLTKLKTLNFSFGGEEDLEPKFSDININDIEIEEPMTVNEEPQKTNEFEAPIEKIDVGEVSQSNDYVPYLDENHNPIELDDEERAILEEEARAEKNRQYLENKKNKAITNKIANKVELPPKQVAPKQEISVDFMGDCNCGPDEACGKCIDTKY